MVVCVHGVCSGALTAGDAVLFLQLMAQLYAPLKFIGSYYRQVRRTCHGCANRYSHGWTLM